MAIQPSRLGQPDYTREATLSEFLSEDEYIYESLNTTNFDAE
jgi:hypothetical protein